MTNQSPPLFDPAMLAGLAQLASIDPATLTAEQRAAVQKALSATEHVIGVMVATMQPVSPLSPEHEAERLRDEAFCKDHQWPETVVQRGPYGEVQVETGSDPAVAGRVNGGEHD